MLDAWALQNSAWKKKLVGWLAENAHLRGARCLHALCQPEAESMRAYGLKNPIAIIPNGIELPALDQYPRTANPRPRRLLFLGRLHPKKGLGRAIQGWKNVGDSAQKNGWQFLIAGWEQAGHRAELERICEEAGLRRRSVSATEFLAERRQSTKDEAAIIFLGSAFGDTKGELLRSVDSFILPSYSEGLPMTVLEAWAHGLPVLMTSECNLPEGFAANAAIRISHRSTGGPDSTASIEDGLRNLFDMSDAERSEMGARGRRLVEEQFTWPKIASQMREVYEWALGGGRIPGYVQNLGAVFSSQ